MSDEINQPLIVSGVDVTHARLVDLAKLADQAEPFYLWVEAQFQRTLDQQLPLDTLLLQAAEEAIEQAIRVCYGFNGQPDVPLLFDGIGRSYPHLKACYYFFA